MVGYLTKAVLLWVLLNLFIIPFSFGLNPIILSSELNPSPSMGRFGAFTPLSQTVFQSSSSFAFFPILLLLLFCVFAFSFYPSHKKGQVTFIIIIALLILFAFGFLLYAVNLLRTSQIENEQQKTIDNYLQVHHFQQYVDECLRRTSGDVLFDMGRQGGALWNVSGKAGMGLDSERMGSMQWKKYFTFNESFRGEDKLWNISYAIRNPAHYDKGSPLLHRTRKAPYYPYNFTNLSLREESPHYLIKTPFSLSGHNPGNPPNIPEQYFLGIHLPYLCSDARENKDYCYVFESLKLQGNDIEGEFIERINVSAKNCVKAGLYRFLLSSAFSFTLDDSLINLSLTYGEEDISIHLHYPVIIHIKDEDPIVHMFDFRAQHHVRLKQMYELAWAIAERTAKNPKFRIAKDYDTLNTCANYTIVYINPDDPSFTREAMNIRCAKEGMEVTVFRDICEDPLQPCSNQPISRSHYVVNITDDDSSLFGKPYTFLFAMQNRMPALDYISWKAEDNALYLDFVQNDSSQEYLLRNDSILDLDSNGVTVEDYDVVFDFDETDKAFWLYALDPDNDGILFYYSNASYDPNFAHPLGFSPITYKPLDSKVMDMAGFPAGDYWLRIYACDTYGSIYVIDETKCDYQDVHVLIRVDENTVDSLCIIGEFMEAPGVPCGELRDEDTGVVIETYSCNDIGRCV